MLQSGMKNPSRIQWALTLGLVFFGVLKAFLKMHETAVGLFPSFGGCFFGGWGLLWGFFVCFRTVCLGGVFFLDMVVNNEYLICFK